MVMFFNPKSQKKSGLVLGAMLALSAAGCASDAASDEAAVDSNDELALAAPSTTTKTLKDPNDTYFAEVKANGTGCPAGTWNTELAEDGKTFTTTFSAYEAEVNALKAVDVKDCNLAIKLHSPQGLSYSVQSFYYQGYAFLEPGVTGRQTANYYFQGNPVDSSGARTELKGEYDDDYLFQDNVAIADQVWSPCGTTRDLNVVTRLRVQNTSRPRRTGYMNLSSVDGSAKLVLKLSWRACKT